MRLQLGARDDQGKKKVGTNSEVRLGTGRAKNWKCPDLRVKG